MIPEADGHPPLSERPDGPADSVGARRVRHAFRFAVLACVMTTVTLWFSENYLRYPKPERLYRMALLLEDDSARALLRNLVPKDGEVPQDPRYGAYLAALAFIEDGTWDRERQGIYESYAVDPLVIERYEQALSADKENPFILMMFGCALFLDGQYTRARDLFRDARRFTDPEDALPIYLEAAARAQLGEMQEALSLIRQTNDNPAMRVHTPEPLWHATLPRQGTWYAKMQRRLTERALAPLVKLKDLVCDQAARRMGGRSTAPSSAPSGGETPQPPIDTDAWLREIEALGMRMLGIAPIPRAIETANRHEARASAEKAPPPEAGNPESDEEATAPITLQARMGILFQEEALRLRMNSLSLPAAERDAAARRLAVLEDAQAQLQAFDDQREERTREHAIVVNRPGVLCLQTAAALFLAYLIVYILAKRMHAGRMAWAIPHPIWALTCVAAAFGVLFVFLLGFLLLQVATRQPGVWLVVLTYAWYGVIALALAAGLVYPRLVRPATTQNRAAGKTGASGASSNRASRLRTYASFLRRYYGILAASFIVLLCAYVIAHRLVLGLYPWIQAQLLITGLKSQELDLVSQVQTLLRGALL